MTDLTNADVTPTMEWSDAGATSGSLVRVQALATDRRLRAAYPGLAAAAGALATPQTRAVATVGGALLQRTRCWYYRNPPFSCYKTGADTCPARHGVNLYGVCFDLGPCVWPHPSTLGMACLAYDATVTHRDGGELSMRELFGDGSDATCDHTLAAGDVLTSVRLPPRVDERAAYFLAISRYLAEWPLVEATVRLGTENGAITWARVALGGVANVPLRAPAVEAALVGQAPETATLERAAALATKDANPLPMTGYKVELVQATIVRTLTLAWADDIGVPPIPNALPWKNPARQD